MWLIEPGLKERMESHKLNFVEAQAEYEARYDEQRAYGVVGRKAVIGIRGIMSKRPSYMAYFFGGGNITYGAISQALAAAQEDDGIDEIELAIDSPGGTFDGLFDAIGTMQTIKKPMTARVDGMAASAAYAIASQADKITVANRANRVGSIGIVASYYVSPNDVTITSSKAPKKAPDVKTKTGRRAVVDQLDDLHALFVEAIAAGRGTTTDLVNKKYGQGAMILADRALELGMIDKIENAGLRPVETETRGQAVDISTIEKEYPEVYKAIFQAGIDAERDRVSAHLTMGEASGDMKTACEAIKDGAGMTATLQAKYLTAGMNRADIKARQKDNVDVDTGKDTGKDTGNEVLAIIEEKLGIGKGGE